MAKKKIIKKPEEEINEDQFWAKMDDIKQEPITKSTGNIEKSMSQGVSDVFCLVKNEITKLNRDERIAYATLKDDPLFGEYIESMIRTKRHEKGWLTKQLFNFWQPFVQAFHSIYQNKQIRKALNKSNYSNNLFGD